MLLNKTSRHRGNIPWSCRVPVIVYVFPDDVIPYVNNKPDKQINNKTSMIRTEMAGSPQYILNCKMFFESLGNSSYSSRKQFLGISLIGKFSYLKNNMCTH